MKRNFKRFTPLLVLIALFLSGGTAFASVHQPDPPHQCPSYMQTEADCEALANGFIAHAEVLKDELLVAGPGTGKNHCNAGSFETLTFATFFTRSGSGTVTDIVYDSGDREVRVEGGDFGYNVSLCTDGRARVQKFAGSNLITVCDSL